MATESENLTREADDAKAAIGRTLKQLQHELGHTADPRAWLKAHPWATLGAAVVAGFAAVELMVPSAEEKAMKHLAALEASLRRESQAAEEAASNGHDSAPPAAEKPHHKLLSTLAVALFQVGRPILTTLLTALASRPEPPQEQDKNGDHEPTNQPAERS